MADKDNEKLAPKKLSLTKTLESKVQQNLSKGKSKTVTVEVKKTRTFNRTGNTVKETSSDGLSESEQAARLKALQEASSRPTTTPTPDSVRPRTVKIKDDNSLSADDLIPASDGTKKLNVVQDAPDEPEAPAAAPSSSRRVIRQRDGMRKLDTPRPPREKPAPRAKTGAAAPIAPELPSAKAVEKKKPKESDIKVDKKKPASKTKDQYNKSKGTLTINNAMYQEERMRSLAAVKRKRQKEKRQSDSFLDETKEKKIRDIKVTELITVQELANRMAEKAGDVVKELMKLGVMARPQQEIDADTADLIVQEFGHKTIRVSDSDVEDLLDVSTPPEEELETRAPVVTIMGHVDHGKTSLLDALRESSVTTCEAGGITQHIGAYQYKSAANDVITFIDTPGHAAFTAMRARGASVTDIVILVVAANDGIMPQTVEAINHAKAAEVPIIVAINKIDLPEADPQKVKNELLSHELIPEDLGGDIMTVEVSAQAKTNLDGLIEAILLQTELLEPKASPKQRANGIVIEAKVDKGRGIVTTVLVQGGTLKKGDLVVAGVGYGKVKALMDEKGKQLKEAGPSVPVEILGLNELPNAGDKFARANQEKDAREVIEYRKKLEQHNKAQMLGGNSVDDIFKISSGGLKEFCVIIKGDVQGSVEAIVNSFEKIQNDEIRVKVVHAAAGGITDSDITLAEATGAMVLGFNVRAEKNAKDHAERDNITVKYYSIIYDLLDDVKDIMNGLLTTKTREEFIGYAEIRDVFKITRVGKVAGCFVTEGFIERGAGVRLLRDNVVIHQGKLKTLKRFKEEVDQVKEAVECGMAFENYEDIRKGDVIEAFRLIEEKSTLDDA